MRFFITETLAAIGFFLFLAAGYFALVGF